MQQTTAAGRWDELDAQRQPFVRRCEEYAAFTVPKVCPPLGYNQNNDKLQHDYQSLGAQATNHLSNKMMLALFAPSRPFFRLDPSQAMQDQMAQLNITPAQLVDKLADTEKSAVQLLDQRSVRPKLYDILKHIIITGNALPIYLKDSIRVLGIKNFCVKRGVDGKVLEVVTREDVPVASLDDDVKAALGNKLHPDEKDCIKLYNWLKSTKGGYTHEMWVDGEALPSPFSGKYTEDTMPYRPVTWDLASGDDYGTGLVEDYSGDFAALSIMSKATVQAAILASEFRWLVNPTAQTKPDDFEASENGAALPGIAGDITLIQSGKSADLQVNMSIAEQYIKRIGQGFLLQSAVTRDAERVTAEEIRAQAEELESSLGGAYTRIAVDIQVPTAHWLLAGLGRSVAGTDLKPTIVTGLAALSRSGDRDNLVLFLQDCTQVASLPPQIQDRFKVAAIFSAFAAARGLNADDYLLTEQDYQALEQQKQQQLMNQQAALAGQQAAQQNITQQGAQQ